MSAASSLSASEPVLRTLAPALQELENGLRSWLSARHPQPLTTLQKSSLIGLADDLGRQGETLRQDQPLLVVVLMGGTGVGKSTLLNALAGGAIASASIQRPTTRDPVVYLHQTVPTQKLDPVLQACKLASHDRPSLQYKIIVDTPDLDGNELANREKLFRILPVADVVLYVGSQEKYHDQLGWDLFLEQKKRRAFAFVLNKWDRCQSPGVGTRPDHDWICDLKASGFDDPLLFRTCAQHWVDHAWQDVEPPPTPPVPGENFLDLVHWLESGLSRLEVEAIKARGVTQLLDHLDSAMESTCPPDLTSQVERTHPVWADLIHHEADESAELLLGTLDPYHGEIEAHFSDRRRHLFTGLMGWYLGVVHKLRNFGGSWKPKIPWMPPLTMGTSSKSAIDFNLAAFLRQCSQEASDRHLDARTKAFSNRLLLDAENQGLPLRLLGERIEAVAGQDWKTRNAQAMHDVMSDVERSWAEPAGPRKWIQRGLIVLANTLPSLALLSITIILLWQYFMQQRSFDRGDFILPAVVVFLTMVVLHVLIALLLPMRWPTLRAEFHRHMRERLDTDLTTAYDPLPARLADDLLADRKRAQHYLGEVREIADWLKAREQAASVGQLFGAS